MMKSPFTRKLAAGILLFALILQISGMVTFRLWMRYQIKSEVRNAINKGIHPESITKMSFPLINGEVVDSDFFWEEKGDEFTYMGRWFDVLTSNVRDGKIDFLVVEDGKDDQLETAWTQINSTGQNSSQHKNCIIKFFSLFVADHLSIESPVYQEAHDLLTFISARILPMSLEVPEQPPASFIC